MSLKYSIRWYFQVRHNRQWLIFLLPFTFATIDQLMVYGLPASFGDQIYLNSSFNILLMIEISVVISESSFKRSLCYPKIKLMIFVYLAMDISSINNTWCQALILEGAIFSLIRQLQSCWVTVEFKIFLLCPDITDMLLK